MVILRGTLKKWLFVFTLDKLGVRRSIHYYGGYPMKETKTSLKVATLVVFAVLVVLNAGSAFASDTLNPGQILKRGEFLTSENQQYTLILQRDGNLVLYDGKKRPMWTSNTTGQRVQGCVMQGDGNLVLFLRTDQPVWSTNTAGKPGSFLVLQNDGNLVIYQPQAIWASNTHRGERDERRGRWNDLFDRRDYDRREDKRQ
jgi:hypothetical protein